MYDVVLVPTDGSDASRTAVEEGVSIADRFGATVHFLHVVDVGTEMAASGVGTVADELTDTLETVATDALEEAESRARSAGVAHEQATLEGYPHEAIGDYAADHDVDLIVLGESGRTGLEEHLLGSTTERVARSSDVSVLIARP